MMPPPAHSWRGLARTGLRLVAAVAAVFGAGAGITGIDGPSWGDLVSAALLLGSAGSVLWLSTWFPVLEPEDASPELRRRAGLTALAAAATVVVAAIAGGSG